MAATLTLMTIVNNKPVFIARTDSATEAAELLRGHTVTRRAAILEAAGLYDRLAETIAAVRAADRKRRIADAPAQKTIGIGVAGDFLNLTIQAD